MWLAMVGQYGRWVVVGRWQVGVVNRWVEMAGVFFLPLVAGWAVRGGCGWSMQLVMYWVVGRWLVT